MSPNLLRTLIDIMPDFIYVKDTESRFLVANAAVAHVMGAETPDALLGKTDHDFYPPELADRYRADEQEVILQGRPLINREEPVIDRAGNLRWVSTTKVPLYDEQGKVVGLVGIGRDITERKQMEEALRESEARFRRLAENAQDLIYRYRLVPPRGFEYVNPAATAIVGYTPEEHYADPDLGFKIVHPDDRWLLQKIAQKPTTQPVALRWVHKDGRIVWTEQRNVPVYDAAGNLIAIEGIARDITEQKKAEEALCLYSERLKILREVDQAILAARTPEEIAQAATSRVLRLLACHGACVILFDAASRSARLLAMETAGKIGVKVGEVFPLADFQRLSEVQGGQPLLVEDLTQLPFLSPAAQRILQEGLRAYLMAPLMVKGDLIGVFGLGYSRPHSFTPEEVEIAQELAAQLAIALHQAELHRQLEETNAELRKALAAKDEMIANVSHELRTPLTQIIGYGELLFDGILGGCALSPDQRHAIQVILDRAQVLNRLVDALLTLQTLTREDLAWLEVDLKTLTETALKRWRNGRREEEWHIQVEVPDTLPHIRGDANRLRQALDQLLDNAAKFSGEEKALFIKAWQQAKEVWLSISDRGIGIPPDKLEDIFTLFYQVNGSSTRRYGGMGIGLSLARHIVTLHGGRIWAESEGIPGRGSTFTLAFPIA